MFYCSSDYFWPGYLLKSSSFLTWNVYNRFFFIEIEYLFSATFYVMQSQKTTKEETFILNLVFVTNNSNTSLIRLTCTIFHANAQNSISSSREIIQIKIGHSICIQIKFIEHDRSIWFISIVNVFYFYSDASSKWMSLRFI